jgi:hypothetical protein
MPVVTFSSGTEVTIWIINQKIPLDVARDNERLDAARLLKEWTRGMNSQDRINSALLASSQGSSPNVEQPSVVHGEDIFITGWSTLLHTASKDGKIEIVQSLLEAAGMSTIGICFTGLRYF